MSDRIFNFSAGPGVLPLPVLEEAQRDLINWKGTGLSVMEMSHRSKEYDSIIKDAEQRLIRLLNIPDTHKVLFLQGGANTQFSMIPLNLLDDNESADYIITGNWTNKAYKEAIKIGKKANIAATSEKDNFNHIPEISELKLDPNASHIHYTSNNTIFGTAWREFPDFKDKMVVCDMSSDFLSRPVDVSKFGLIYAGAQKNAGPAGVTIVIIRKDLIGKNATKDLPTMMNYKTHADKDSMYNTPPTFAIYIVGLVFKWLEELGGLKEIEKMNIKKSDLLYNAIDNSNGFYRGTAAKKDRSWMNVTFVLKTPELDAKFIEEAKKYKLMSLKGYRTVGGIRTSIYNAFPYEGVVELVKFMEKFQKEN